MTVSNWFNPWTTPKTPDLQTQLEAAIRAMGLRAWYSNHVGSSATKMVDISGNGVADATVGAGSNSPRWLPYTSPQVHVPVGSGNHVRVARDLVSVPVTWDCAVRVKFSALSTLQYLAGSNSTHAALFIDAADKLRIMYRNDALTYVGNYVPTVAVPSIAINTWVWLRGRLTATDANTEIWYSYDDTDVYDDVNWTLIEAGIGLAPSANLNNSQSNTVMIGNYTTSGSSLGDNTYRASTQIYNGTDRIDWLASETTQTGGITAAGKVITVGRATTGRKTVVQSPAASSTRGVWLFGTDDYITVPAAAMPNLDVGLSGTVIAVWREWATLSAIARLWDTRAIDNTTVGTRGVAARKSGGGTTGVLMSDDTATLVSRNISGISAGVRYVSTSVWDATNVNQYTNNTAAGTTARPAGSLVSGNDVLVGAATTTTRFMDGEFTAWLSADRALTAAEIAQIVAFYGGGL